jgi:hypothetical protein
MLLPRLLLAGQITCNSNPGLSAAFLVGMGPSYPIYNTWFLNYGSGLFQLKYFNSDSTTTVSEILASASSLSFVLFCSFFPPPFKDPRPDIRAFGHWRADDLDFAAPNQGLTSTLQASLPDVKPIPSFAFAVVPGYNVLLQRPCRYVVLHIPLT